MKMSQSDKIWKFLTENQGKEIPAVVLHRVGSGKENGFCASLSRRISDIRAFGGQITCRKQNQPDGQIHSFYTLV